MAIFVGDASKNPYANLSNYIEKSRVNNFIVDYKMYSKITYSHQFTWKEKICEIFKLLKSLCLFNFDGVASHWKNIKVGVSTEVCYVAQSAIMNDPKLKKQADAEFECLRSNLSLTEIKPMPKSGVEGQEITVLTKSKTLRLEVPISLTPEEFAQLRMRSSGGLSDREDLGDYVFAVKAGDLQMTHVTAFRKIDYIPPYKQGVALTLNQFMALGLDSNGISCRADLQGDHFGTFPVQTPGSYGILRTKRDPLPRVGIETKMTSAQIFDLKIRPDGFSDRTDLKDFYFYVRKEADDAYYVTRFQKSDVPKKGGEYRIARHEIYKFAFNHDCRSTRADLKDYNFRVKNAHLADSSSIDENFFLVTLDAESI